MTPSPNFRHQPIHQHQQLGEQFPMRALLYDSKFSAENRRGWLLLRHRSCFRLTQTLLRLKTKCKRKKKASRGQKCTKCSNNQTPQRYCFATAGGNAKRSVACKEMCQARVQKVFCNNGVATAVVCDNKRNNNNNFIAKCKRNYDGDAIVIRNACNSNACDSCRSCAGGKCILRRK